MAAYKPKKSLLLHEMVRKSGPAIPTIHGGWDDATKTFVPIESYSAFKKMLKADGFDSTVGRVFLDAFTAAVEAGELNGSNWFSAFAELPDWKKLAGDLVESGPIWVSERVRQAFAEVFKANVDEANAYVQNPILPVSFEAAGLLLKNQIDWKAVAKLLPEAPKSEQPRLRLVKAG